MNYKQVFIEYVEARGHKLLPNTVNEDSNGVWAVIETDRMPLEQFTQAIIHDRQDKVIFSVRLSCKDFENTAITGGLIEPECSHSDTRICQGLGHAE